MVLWTVYDRPADEAHACEVRKVLIEDDGLHPDDRQLFRHLTEARSALARQGLIRVPRAAHDDPALLETWL
ncbi:MAG TPA: hypothetical protein VLW85_25750 [Myxococcales bacterium]|nr:hypothetical protein [Myxococcales bacterium]